MEDRFQESIVDERRSVELEPIEDTIHYKANKQYEETARMLKEQEEREKVESLTSTLAGKLTSIWRTNRDHHEMYIKPVLDKCMLLLRGEYDSETKALIRESGGTDIYLPIAAQTASTIEAWLIDILTSAPQGNKPWGLEPTPVPELPDDVVELVNLKLVQEGKEAEQQGVKPSQIEIESRANEVYDTVVQTIDRIAYEGTKIQEKFVEDALEEAGFNSELKRLLSYISVFPTAFMIGPLYRTGFKNIWRNGKLKQIETIISEFKAESPYDVFPAPNAQKIDDGDLVHRMRLSRKDLESLKGLPGSNDSVIDEVIDNFNSYANWTQTNDYVREQGEGRNPYTGLSHSATIEVLSFYANVSLSDIDVDIPEEVLACVKSQTVDIEALMVGGHILRFCIVDTNKPYYRRPIYATSYRKVPDSIWGKSPIMLAAEIDSICNSCVRALVNNLSISSGPLVAIDISQLPQGYSLESLHPWQIFQFSSISGQGTGGPPIKFFSPPSNSGELLGVFNNFLQRAAEVTGIPSFLMGSSIQRGPASTAKGLEALINSSSKGIKLALSNVSEDIIKPIVYQQFTANILQGKGDMLYGDVNVVPKGFNALVLEGAKEERMQSFLMLLKSPEITNILGIKGVTELVRQFGEIADFDVSGVIPTDEELEERAKLEAQKEQKPTPEELDVQVQMQKIQADLKKAEDRMKMQQQRLAFEQQKWAEQKELKEKELQVELAKVEMKSQANIQQTIAASLGKERIQDKEIKLKLATGSGI